MDFDGVLARFKEREQPECLLLLSDDPESLKIIVAWTGVRISRIPESHGTVTDDWEALWRCVDYTIGDIAERMGISEYVVERKMRRLIASRAIYPDGTANSFVQRYLRQQVVDLFRTPKKDSPKESHGRSKGQ